MLPRLLILAFTAILWSNAAGQDQLVENPVPQPGTPATGPLLINLQDALARAKANNQQFQTATISAQLAHEDRVQAKAGLLPTLNYFNQYIYTQANGTPSGVFVANDGVHVYNSQGVVHGDIYAPGKLADYQRLIAAEAVARAKTDIAARSLRSRRGAAKWRAPTWSRRRFNWNSASATPRRRNWPLRKTVSAWRC